MVFSDPERLLWLKAGGPDGASDVVARSFAAKLTEYLGRQVTVENRVGAGGNVAAEYVARSPADGYTILMITTTFAINPGLYPKLPYDPVRDFSTLGEIGFSNSVIVAAPALGVNGALADKASRQVHPGDAVVVTGDGPRFVSRGGEKLDGALEAFQLEVTGWRVLDAGASTGGFTDCLLQRGASRVYAVDVGYGQLAWKLRQDPRVVVMERTKQISSITEPICGKSSHTSTPFLPNFLNLCCGPKQVSLALHKPPKEFRNVPL